MRNQNLYLNKLQITVLMYAIEKKRIKNHFTDGIVTNFEKYAVKRTHEIESYSSIKKQIMPTADKYIIPKSMIEYLINFTDVDILDSEVLNKYIHFIFNEPKKVYKKH